MVAETRRPDEPSTIRIRLFARGLALVWAIGWTAFLLVLAFLRPERPTGDMGTALVVCMVLMCSALVGWRCEGIAAIVLFSEGCGALAILTCLAIAESGHFTLVRGVLVTCALSLPPLVAGLLFHASWRKSRDFRAAHMFKVTTEWDIVSLISWLIQSVIS